MNTLLAQVVFQAPQSQFAWGTALLWAACAVVLLVLVPVFVVMRHVHVRRGWDHAERMRMIEMGLAVPPRDGSVWPKALVGISIGVGVPLVAFLCTLMAYMGRSNAADELWVAPAVVSGLSVIGAVLLSAHMFSRRAGSDAGAAEPELRAGHGMKPEMDPDAYDVAGRRG
jgi:hypothetical protein